MTLRNGVVAAAGAAICLASLMAAGALLLAKRDAVSERTVVIQVKRFEYLPREITLEKDVPVILELISLDVPHGFNLPDLHVRADALPGRPAKVRIVPHQTGRFVFHCDIFCGSGHEELEGVVVVTDHPGSAARSTDTH
jgi:cytochrome c oxidase subunit II